MAESDQIRGMVLEEVILRLLASSGYQTVRESGNDPTLSSGPAGIRIRGRGAPHQVDAIADFRIGQPFSHPQRLLVEAKATKGRVGLDVVRNSLAVLKDVSEYWADGQRSLPSKRRFHYCSAIFSISEFSKDAQSFAFAHDIYLFPLRRSLHLRPVIDAITSLNMRLPADGLGRGRRRRLSELRNSLRRHMQPGALHEPTMPLHPELVEVVRATEQVGLALIAVVGRAFPVFLVPQPGLNLMEAHLGGSVEIGVPDPGTFAGWGVRLPGTSDSLFSFDLPEQVFAQYGGEGGLLSSRAAADLKEAMFTDFTAIYAPGQQVRVINFILDRRQLARMRGES
jgi:hypothetical protein